MQNASNVGRLFQETNGLEIFSPKRFIIDKNLKIKQNLHLIDSAKKHKTYIFYNKSKNINKKLFLRKGVKLIKMKLNEEGNFDLSTIIKKIYSLGIYSLLIEGGVQLTNNFNTLTYTLKNCLILCFTIVSGMI